MAELHIIGQILGATGFNSQNLFCKWGVTAGRSWELLEGLDSGQTQLDLAPDGEPVVWAHPLDLHYACRGLAGGYGFCHVPTTPGQYELDCPTWIPEGTLGERIAAFFLGGPPRLKYEEVVYTPGDRFRLHTVAAGVVQLRLGVIAKDFERNHVLFG